MTEKEFTWITISIVLTVFLLAILIHDEGIDCQPAGTETPPTEIVCQVRHDGGDRPAPAKYRLEK